MQIPLLFTILAFLNADTIVFVVILAALSANTVVFTTILSIAHPDVFYRDSSIVE